MTKTSTELTLSLHIDTKEDGANVVPMLLFDGKTVREVLLVVGVLNPDTLLLLFPVTKGKAEEEEAMCPQRHRSCELRVDVPPKVQSQRTYASAHKQSFGNKKEFYHKHKHKFAFVSHKHKNSFGIAPIAHSRFEIKKVANLSD